MTIMRIQVSRIVFDPKVQPRPVNEKWVEDLIDSIREGYPVSPIRVGKRANEWVCIEGHHRTTAFRRLGMERIDAIQEHEPEEAWPGLAIKYNDRKGHATTKEERDRRIRQMYEDGLTPAKIAEYIGRSQRYVYKVLKPLKEVERAEREAEIRRLREKGLTQEEIAQRMGVTRQAVGKRLKKKAQENQLDKETKLFAQCAKSFVNERNVGNGAGGTQDNIQLVKVRQTTPNQASLTSPPNQEPAMTETAESSANEVTSPSGGEVSNEEPSVEKEPGAEVELEHDEGVLPETAETEGGEVNARKPKPAEPVPEIMEMLKLGQKYPSIVPYFAKPFKFTKHEAKVGRILELMHHRADLVDMCEDLDVRMEWVRKVVMAALGIAASGYSEQAMAKARFAFKLDQETAKVLSQDWHVRSDFRVLGEGMDEWVKEQLRPEEIRRVMQFLDVTPKEFRYVVQNLTPPPRVIKRLSDEGFAACAEAINSAAVALENVAQWVEEADLEESEVTELLEECNRVQYSLNRVYDKLREEAKQGFLGGTDALGDFTRYI